MIESYFEQALKFLKAAGWFLTAEWLVSPLYHRYGAKSRENVIVSVAAPSRTILMSKFSVSGGEMSTVPT